MMTIINNHSWVGSPAPQSLPSSWTVVSTLESGSLLLSASGLLRRYAGHLDKHCKHLHRDFQELQQRVIIIIIIIL